MDFTITSSISTAAWNTDVNTTTWTVEPIYYTTIDDTTRTITSWRAYELNEDRLKHISPDDVEKRPNYKLPDINELFAQNEYQEEEETSNEEVGD